MGFFQQILNAISPQLRKLVVEFILSLKEKAAATDNPLDDIVVALLISLFGISDKKDTPE
ncbi:MAG: hypothetical protein GH151_02175 [Bacteroidetes bacterium]|nr:hypothetical protein [Bacteroidota bacterium]